MRDVTFMPRRLNALPLEGGRFEHCRSIWHAKAVHRAAKTRHYNPPMNARTRPRRSFCVETAADTMTKVDAEEGMPAPRLKVVHFYSHISRRSGNSASSRSCCIAQKLRVNVGSAFVEPIVVYPAAVPIQGCQCYDLVTTQLGGAVRGHFVVSLLARMAGIYKEGG